MNNSLNIDKKATISLNRFRTQPTNGTNPNLDMIRSETSNLNNSNNPNLNANSNQFSKKNTFNPHTIHTPANSRRETLQKEFKDKERESFHVPTTHHSYRRDSSSHKSREVQESNKEFNEFSKDFRETESQNKMFKTEE